MLKILFACLFLSSSAPALAVYKCEANGKIAYGDAPCQGGKSTDLSNQVRHPSASEMAQAQRILAQEKSTVQGIESARH